MTPPTIGASQNSQSWPSAHPLPPKASMIAGPVERAGFTDVLVTGMLTRWISVSARPMASAAKPFEARVVRCPHDDDQEDRSQHHLDDEAGGKVVQTGRVIAVAVRRETTSGQRVG